MFSNFIKIFLFLNFFAVIEHATANNLNISFKFQEERIDKKALYYLVGAETIFMIQLLLKHNLVINVTTNQQQIAPWKIRQQRTFLKNIYK